MKSTVNSGDERKREDELPFVAPCRRLRPGAPLQWLALGWHDLRRAPAASLSYGAATALLSVLVGVSAWLFTNIYTFLALLSGFVFLGPPLAIGVYSISRQLQRGRKPQLGYCLRQGRAQLGNALVFGLMLLIVFLIWARAASMVHVFFPMRAHPSLQDLAMFLTIGLAVGTVFAAIVFAAAAFSLPMILDRRVDTVTAVVTSINAVFRNKAAMLVWALLIVALVGASFATGFLGFIVTMPLLGHGTWHAYRQTIDASAWPESESDSV